jgi:hypothetical protein
MKMLVTRISIVLTLVCGLLLPASALRAQVTSASINGDVHDKSGAPLAGATVQAVHVPSGTLYGVVTRTNGHYNLPNLRTGGPYRIKVSYVGFQAQEKSDVYLVLGQNLRVDFSMTDVAMEMGAVEVIGEQSDLMSASRTGAGTNISGDMMSRLPSISRSFQDFQKLTPQFVGNSALGRNNRFNNIQIDGTSYNDLFGLGSTGTPGASANTTPISLDALQEFEVQLAPYDVRQSGFTGGGINAITRSGTNTFSGSAFFYGRNQNMVGMDTARKKLSKFNEYQYGLRLGGPIVKDKLFFFVSGEMTQREEPTKDIQFYKGTSDPAASVIPADSVTRFINDLKALGYDPGSADPITQDRKSTKLFARLDYNLSPDHKLTLRHNFVDASDDIISRSNTRFYLENSMYSLKSTTNSTVLQMSSMFGNTMSNELILGYTAIRDKRETPGQAFPFIRIKFGGGDLYAGTEEYSIANKLDQDIFEFTDNFTYFLGTHTLTVGTHNEFFKFSNLYIRDYYGYYEFNSLTDFEAGKPSLYSYSYSMTDDPMQQAQLHANQFGFYVQDEWTASTDLRLTLGIRADIPTFPNTPAYNKYVDSTFSAIGINTDVVPKAAVLFSPRLGFNYDPSGNRSTQVRGGIGIFTGRLPYVWISNQYSNTGVEFGRVSATNRPAGFFVTDPYNQPRPGVTPGLSPVATSEIDITASDFKMPQVARLDIAIDQTLPENITGTLEGIYTKAINDILYQDLNLGPQLGAQADGRPVYGTYNTSSRTYSAGRVNPRFTNVIYMKNTDQGYSYSITAQLQRQMLDGLYASAAYTYGESKDCNSVLSSQAYSQWRYNHVTGDPNNPPLAYSAFDIRNRIMANLTYRYEWKKGWATTMSVFYNGQSGTPFSYVYNGDINGDGETENDLIYIPKDENDIILTTSNYDRLNTWIENDSYLKDHRGQIAERMSSRNPWSHIVDLRFIQEVPIVEGHRVEITFDVLNFFNLLKKSWGRVMFVSNQRYRLLKFEGLDASSGKPKFSFNDNNGQLKEPFEISDLASRWQLQMGIRYTF